MPPGPLRVSQELCERGLGVQIFSRVVPLEKNVCLFFSMSLMIPGFSDDHAWAGGKLGQTTGL